MINYEVLRDKSPEERFEIAREFYAADDFLQCEITLSMVLDQDPHNRDAIILLGGLYQKLDRYGMSEIIYRYGVALHPESEHMWVGLGSAIRNPFRSEESLKILKYAHEINPNSTVAMTNIASMYNEICEYDEAMKWAKMSMKGRENDKPIAAIDSMSYAHLGREEFEEGFKLHTETLGVKYRKEIIYGEEERWDGEKGKAVVIYGEQGIGDEIFYGSVIPDAIEDCKKVIIDCDPRLEGLFKRSFPKAIVYGTRWKTAPWLHDHKWDARCAMGDLSVFYRKKKEDYKGKPFLKADPMRSYQWASLFGSRTKIGIAFRGGNKFTNRKSRTIGLSDFTPLIKLGDLVSLEYSDFDYGKFPIEVYNWATQSEDYDNVAALVSQLDYVVTTCTSVVHLAGGLGIPCFVLTPKYPSWRYAHDMPCYNSVRIIHCDGDWEKGIKEVRKLIELRKVA